MSSSDMLRSGIERRIVTGMIVSDEFLKKITRIWRDDLLEVPELYRFAKWCLEYYEKYKKAPEKDIEGIFYERVETEQIPKSDAVFMEKVLETISTEFGRGDKFNVAYLYDRTIAYLREREIETYIEEVQAAKDRGGEDIERIIKSFKPKTVEASRGLDVGSDAGLASLERAFSNTFVKVLEYPGEFGKMVNPLLVQDGFVAFMGPEKRGKSWFLLDAAMRTLRQRSNVAMFQAGDMTEAQTLRRIGIYIAQRSDDERNCEPYWRSVGDCVKNQFDDCTRKDRNCTFGVYDIPDTEFVERRNEFESMTNLSKKAAESPDYHPCSSYACRERVPTMFVTREPDRQPLTGLMARKRAAHFFTEYKRRFKLATYAAGTLSCDEINSCLDEWESEDDFIPNLIIVDYADIMTDPEREFRHRQDAIWKGLRGISQQRHALLITATQADAASYKQNRVGASNFSEDKRKLAHVTGMLGLGQSPDGREKELGIMRINMIVARETFYPPDQDVVVLQDLRRGKPFTDSYIRKWGGSSKK